MTHRIHNIASIQYDIKYCAETTRTKRIHARTLHGIERDAAKFAAYDFSTRWLLLAYGYLRGLTIAQMESETTRWENRPDVTRILIEAKQYFNKGADVTPETGADWAAFTAMVQADIEQWHARLIIKNAEKKAQAHRAVA